ncbi:metalloregulator ArsR/SmtB family transcription factor [bacterium]|nr:metalloregulator ArsR/SmtB family transcription factor [bacterium]
MDQTVKRLKALSDSTRLRILHLISLTKECCVCEIHEVLDLTAPTTSRSLRILEEAGFVARRRAGKWMHYRLREMDREWTQVRDHVLVSLDDSTETRTDRNRFEAWKKTGTCGVNPDPAAIRDAISKQSSQQTIKDRV